MMEPSSTVGLLKWCVRVSAALSQILVPHRGYFAYISACWLYTTSVFSGPDTLYCFCMATGAASIQVWHFSRLRLF